jgi:PHD/YefM family antitoxin component YafN of YafNO toxin-antitoxin module
MTAVVIEKKKYVIIPEKEYQALQKKAALKTKPEKLLSVEEARKYSKKMIRKWATEK